jgi:hypothetical protein
MLPHLLLPARVPPCPYDARSPHPTHIRRNESVRLARDTRIIRTGSLRPGNAPADIRSHDNQSMAFGLCKVRARNHRYSRKRLHTMRQNIVETRPFTPPRVLGRTRILGRRLGNCSFCAWCVSAFALAEAMTHYPPARNEPQGNDRPHPFPKPRRPEPAR